MDGGDCVMNTTTRKARRDSDQIAIHTLDPDHTRKLADDAKELTIVSVIAALLVGIAIAIFVLIVLPRPADARGFPWFFQHIKPPRKPSVIAENVTRNSTSGLRD